MLRSRRSKRGSKKRAVGGIKRAGVRGLLASALPRFPIPSISHPSHLRIVKKVVEGAKGTITASFFSEDRKQRVKALVNDYVKLYVRR
jgi:hypothetical protein